METEKLIKIGGKEWVSGNLHRVYFNNLEDLYGFEHENYKTGRLMKCKLDGETISNSRGYKIQSALSGKLYYDVTTRKFGSQHLGENVVEALVKEITRRVK